ncbi:MAG: RNA pyrophosphohydrolase [Gammaproteobacteria bacterium]|nr:RNA pyrophosphohydrolase [Gammaproteobacteria bacterium]
MIDAQGFRANVGIVLLNVHGQAFWARRIGMSAWQFPQGGVNPDESLIDAMYRELWEEIGLGPDDVEVIGCTRRWLRYRLPRRFIRHDQQPLCIGQKQRWYMLKLTAADDRVDLRCAAEPEFDRWRWIDYWDSLRLVVPFKRGVYEKALHELAPLAAGFADLAATAPPPRLDS